MKALLYKQLSLVCHPMTLVFALFGVMLIIPNYPYTVAFFYVTLGIFFMFSNGREQKDIYYSALLPIRKRDHVKGNVIFIMLIEVASLVIAVPFAMLSVKINPFGENQVGLDPNVALFGIVLLLYTLFNYIFLTSFYRTAYKVGISFLKAIIPTSLAMVICEILPHIPALSMLNETTAKANLQQLPILLVGLVVYGIMLRWTYQIAAARYERVDL